VEVVLLDLSLPDSEGIQTFYDVYAHCDGIPVVVLTGLDDQKVAYEALKNGAQDYLVKGTSDESVERCLRYALQRQVFETELWQSERRTRLILENATDAFFAVDEAGLVLAWNAQSERTFGYLRKNAIGQPLAGLIIPVRQRKLFNQELRRYIRGDREARLNCRHQMTVCRRDGEPFLAELTLFTIAEDKKTMLCGFVRDHAINKELDEQDLRQVDRRLLDRMLAVERANDDLQKYNRTITSDLRTRLDLILKQALVLKGQVSETKEADLERSCAALCRELEKAVNHVQPSADSETHIQQTTIMRRAQSQTWSLQQLQHVADQQPV
jgi:PAS domain S-box-containing protein